MPERYERFFRLYIGMVDEYTGNASDKYMRTRRCPGSNKRYGYEMMQKKLNKTDEVKKELYNGFLNMFGIGKGGCPWITKQSIYNQFYSDLVTKVQHGIDVPGTTIHVFYATKMGKKYEKRYCTYFKNPDIRRHNMQHEELFCCHSAEWVEEVRKAVEGDR